MGIRMLKRRPGPARAGAGAVPAPPVAAVPVFAAGASTARVPAGPALVLRRGRTGLARALRALTRPEEPPAWRLWAGLGRSCLTGLLTRRSRGARTVTVFVVPAGGLTGRPGDPPAR
ncbi:hypothetical protein ABT301_02350 [Streptomyces sp. NPDC000987]|uniref:hypothetical protein n=1 Tax=Streptomyces sp. NPDC000987 TaxID=3154374 RepID=UPI0033305958